MSRFQPELTFEIVLEKAQKFCLFRERSESEMERKMKEWGANAEIINLVLDDLVDSKFISNRRFAMAYTRGKFNVKRWGKYKIIQGLRLHKISTDLIQESLNQINEEDYLGALTYILVRKISNDVYQLEKDEFYKRKASIYNFALQKGFESDLILKELERLLRK